MLLTCNLDLTAGDGLNVSIALQTAPVASGALADLSLTVGVAMTPVDVSADFTAVPGSISLTGGSMPAGLSFDGTTLSGTPTAPATTTLTFTKTNNGGSDSTAFQVAVVAAPAVIDMTDLVYTAPADPAPASLAAEYTTTATGDISLFGVTSASATPPPQSEIIAGAGASILEAFNGVLSGGDLLLSDAFTAASNPATHIHALLRNADGSVVSVTLSETVSINIATGGGPAFEYLFTAAADGDLSAQPEFTNIAGSPGVHRIDAATDQLHTILTGAAACHDNIDATAYTVPADAKVSIDFLAHTGTGQSLTGLVARSSSSTTGYIFHVDPEQNAGAGMLRVLRLSDYATVINTTFTAAGVSLPFKGSLVTEGDQISVEIDDVEIASATDATFTAGQAGIFTLYMEGTALQPMDNLTIEVI